MENCKDLGRLFSGNGIVVSFDNVLSFAGDYCKTDYFLMGNS